MPKRELNRLDKKEMDGSGSRPVDKRRLSYFHYFTPDLFLTGHRSGFKLAFALVWLDYIRCEFNFISDYDQNHWSEIKGNIRRLWNQAEKISWGFRENCQVGGVNESKFWSCHRDVNCLFLFFYGSVIGLFFLPEKT